jgi:hypothetical protein
MIYQCYFKKDQEPMLFTTSAYTPFGLEPEVNKSITQNCPELEDPKVRLTLTEYSCFLWFYRNQEKLGNFFGTTSYRQLDKSKIIFNTLPTPEKNCVISWGVSEFFDFAGYPLPMALQAEAAHPGINSYLRSSMQELGHEIPKAWYLNNVCILGNYWILTKNNFINFMDFSWPLVEKALLDFKNKSHHYFTNKMNFGCDSSKAVGYYMERLFILWCIKNNLEIISSNEIKMMRSPLSIYA